MIGMRDVKEREGKKYFACLKIKSNHIKLNFLFNPLLTFKQERLAIFFSGRLDAEKIQMSNRNRIYMRPTSINGLY
jgi:hypothetical protein